MRGIGGQPDGLTDDPLSWAGGGVSGNTERVLHAFGRVAAAAMWPETPSLVPRLFWGVAGSAIFLPTAC
ncbi:MAG: hypothetical protein QOG73_1808, partial [Acetobacteraceae bacterium]|nr:hypothetical protein [Acetobacteraceae bacterium]